MGALPSLVAMGSLATPHMLFIHSLCLEFCFRTNEGDEQYLPSPIKSLRADDLITRFYLLNHFLYLISWQDCIVSANSGSRTLASSAFPKFPAAYGGPKFRCNDGKCDPSGRLWIGTMNAAVHEDENVAEKGRLYRLSKVTLARGSHSG